VFEPQLLGTWSGGFDPAEQAVVTQAGPRSYAIEYTDHQGATVSLVGQLGRTGGRLVLDVQPTAAALGPYRDLVLRLHIPVLLDSIGPQIQVANLEADSLDRYLRAHPRAIAHGRSGDGHVLTGKSPQLWRFFGAYLRRPGVAEGPTTWRRRSP